MRRRLEQLFPAEPAATGWTGDIEVTETDDGWTAKAPLPGVPPEAVEVNVTDRELRIDGEVDQADRESHLFGYRAVLPGEILADHVTAVLEHGVLTVTLPRSPRAAGRRVPVTTPGGASRTSADEHPTEPLPRTQSSSHPPAPSPDENDTAGVEPTTAPPYQQPDQNEPPEDSVTARHPVPGQESPPGVDREGSLPGQHYPGPPPYLPWPNHSKTDQDHPT
jgi:HSP20 family protein